MRNLCVKRALVLKGVSWGQSLTFQQLVCGACLILAAFFEMILGKLLHGNTRQHKLELQYRGSSLYMFGLGWNSVGVLAHFIFFGQLARCLNSLPAPVKGGSFTL